MILIIWKEESNFQKKVLSGASPAKPASTVQTKPEQKQEEKKVKKTLIYLSSLKVKERRSNNHDLSI